MICNSLVMQVCRPTLHTSRAIFARVKEDGLDGPGPRQVGENERTESFNGSARPGGRGHLLAGGGRGGVRVRGRARHGRRGQAGCHCGAGGQAGEQEGQDFVKKMVTEKKYKEDIWS